MRKFLLINLIFLFVPVASLFANELFAGVPIIFVDSSKANVGNGLTPASAFKYFQDALDYAAIQNTTLEIHVAKGTYFPDDGNSVSDGDRDASFKMLNNVKILGGYPSGFQVSKGRNNKAFRTILSGDINHDGTLKTHQIIKNEYDKTNRLTDTAILNGFIIENSDGWPSDGGGVYNNYSSAKIQNCIFRNNKARIGGAVKNIEGIPVFENCIFYNNQSSFGGNVMINENTKVSIINCTITDNYHPLWTNVESIKSESSELTIINSILWGNGSELVDNAGSATNAYLISFSDIAGGYAGTSNLDVDPLFKNPTNRDYSLRVCTPLYNKGTNSASSLAIDYNNAGRILYGTIDIGALEYVTGRLYVNTVATGANNGSDWANAYTYLVDAMDTLTVTGTPAEVWVAQGTYHPFEIGYSVSPNSRDEAFRMLNNVALYGGFLGYETSLSQRDWTSFITVISADLQDNDITNNYLDNAYHVFKNDYTSQNPLTNTAILDGFVVFGANADGALSNSMGGGMYNTYASPIVRNCTFRANRGKYASGMYLENSNIVISNSSFFLNEAIDFAGAMAAFNSNPNITNTTFIQNKTNTTNVNIGSYAGAVQFAFCGGSVTNCSFSNNVAYASGGGLQLQTCTTTFSSCSFSGNRAKAGAGAYLFNVNSTFTDCTFSENWSKNGTDLYGAGMFIRGGNVNLDNCDFIENWCENIAGGVYLTNGIAEITSCSFLNNLTFPDDGNIAINPSLGGAIYMEANTDVIISNCIFDGNESRSGGGAVYNKGDNNSIINSFFINNIALEGSGGSIENDGSDTEIINCTFTETLVAPLATVRNTNGSYPFMYNCIIWGLAAEPISSFNSSIPSVENCIINGGYASGVNILNTDPKFKDVANGDYSLLRCSSAIDFGNNSYNSTLVDLAGNPRIFNPSNPSYTPRIDLGAYEAPYSFQTNCDCPDNLNLSGNTSNSTLRSAETINSGSIILSSQNVTFGADNYIELVPPFETQTNAVFKTELIGCVN